MTYTKEHVLSLLKDNVCNVSFTKRDGTKRDMVCTLKPNMLPLRKTEPKDSGSANPKPENVIVVFDLDKDAWRSFDIETVLSINEKENYVA
jgi:hypothetical protein